MNGKFHFCIHLNHGDIIPNPCLNRATFFLRAVQSHPMSLSYPTDISQNYIPLPHPHYIHHAKCIQKVDKPMIYLMIGSELDIRELI